MKRTAHILTPLIPATSLPSYISRNGKSNYVCRAILNNGIGLKKRRRNESSEYSYVPKRMMVDSSSVVVVVGMCMVKYCTQCICHK